MLSSFWQAASIIVLATFGSAVAFSERLSDQSGQRCIASSARDLLEKESVAKDYFWAQRDFERNAFDSSVNDHNRRIRELDSRRFDARTDRLSRVNEDRFLSAKRGLIQERMRSNEIDNEQVRARSQRDRAERIMDSHDQRSVQRHERQEERRNPSNLRRDFRSTLKTVSGRNDDRQYRLSLERDSSSRVGMGRERDLVGSFNTRREMTRLFPGRKQVDDRRQNRGIAEKQERFKERDVQNREERERRVLARDNSERRLRQERSEDNLKRSETRSFNSNERFDINRNVLEASVPLNLNRNNNRRNQQNSREVRDLNREENRVQDGEIRRDNVRIEDAERDGQTFDGRRQTRGTVESHGSTGRRNDRLNERDEHRFQFRNVLVEREIERKMQYRTTTNEIRNTRLERAPERRIQGARTERSVQGTRIERRLEREEERKVRDISVERENERRVQEAGDGRLDGRNVKLERRERDSSAERRQFDGNERLERRVQEIRAERRDVCDSRFEREGERQVRDSVDGRRESRSMRLEPKIERKEQEIRVERRDSRNARLDGESERRKQEAKTERRVTLNAGFQRENERKARGSRNVRFERENTRLQREDERRVQKTRVESRDVRNARIQRESERRIPDDEPHIERRESSNMRLEREDERKTRDSSEERRQDRIVRLDTNAPVDDVTRSSNRLFETRRKLQFSSYSQVDSLKKTVNLNVQMLQALFIGMLLLKVVTQQDMFTKKMNFMADSCKNVVSVGARKLF